jgi:hypothetical protein
MLIGAILAGLIGTAIGYAIPSNKKDALGPAPKGVPEHQSAPSQTSLGKPVSPSAWNKVIAPNKTLSGLLAAQCGPNQRPLFGTWAEALPRRPEAPAQVMQDGNHAGH